MLINTPTNESKITLRMQDLILTCKLTLDMYIKKIQEPIHQIKLYVITECTTDHIII